MRKAEVIGKLHKLGLSISYDRVCQLTTNICNSVCDTYYENGIVCPPHLKKNEFVTAAMDNIDHNLSSTTSKDSFHGTGISINTHLNCSSTSIPKTALSSNGVMRHGTKSDILGCIEPTGQHAVDEKEILSSCSAYIIEGAFLVHMLKPGTNKTFQEYASNVFNKYLKTFINNYERVDIIWDVYKVRSIKNGTRVARGTGCRQKVSANVRLPKSWEVFLRVAENKTGLFEYLAQEMFNDPDIKLSHTIIVSTFGDSVLSNRNFVNRCNMEPCDHEESDTRVMVHLRDMVDAGHTDILLKSVDSDVVVLATSAFSMLKMYSENIRLWIAFGVKKNFR